jgi:hypothetical protein
VVDARRTSDPVFYPSRDAAIAAFLPAAPGVRAPNLVDADEGGY